MLLADLLEEFVLSARAANRSPRTIDSYRWQLQRFERYLVGRGYSLDCGQITARQIREYIGDLQETHAAQTIANNVKALRSVFAFGVREELIDSDPTVRVAVPKVPHRDYEVFDPSDIDTLLQACNARTLTGTRDFAIVMLLFDSGMRATELVTVRDSDVDWQRGLVSVFGKGAKERQVPVSARTLRALRRYQNKRNAAGYVGAPTLFVNNVGYPLTRSGLLQLLERLGKRTGLHVHPHKFRHSFAVNALRNDAREYDIQDCLGHTTLTMTKRYARQTGEDLARRHSRFSPADRLKVRV
jgi:integrase/recombinase XerD